MRKVIAFCGLLVLLSCANAVGDTLYAQTRMPAMVDIKYVTPAVSLDADNFLDELLLDDVLLEIPIHAPPARPRR
jgi:hypothetical protein